MANPPLPLTPSASPITYGVVVHYGLPDIAVTGIIIDSYKRDQQYADTQEVQNQAGVTVGVRMTDFRANVSVDGRVIEEDAAGVAQAFTVKVGDILTINGDKIVINSVSYSGAAKGFHSLSISGTSYSGILALAPSGVITASTT
jgi:hypothetical protein